VQLLTGNHFVSCARSDPSVLALNVRVVVVSCVVFALLFFTSGAALLNCPFLSQPSSPAPCCPRETGNRQGKCPLSKSLDTCPFYVTEGKIGAAKDKVVVVVPANEPRYPIVFDSSDWLVERSSTWVPQLTDLHVRLRVLRI
jgi:hypothetical protein